MLQDIQALVKNGDIQQAWTLLQKVPEFELGEQGYYLAAVCSRYLSKPNNALNYIQKLLKLNAKHARAYQEQAYNYLLLKQPEKADFSLQKALIYNPSLVSAWLKLAEIYTVSDKQNLAENALANAEHYQNLPLHIRSGYSKLYEGNIAQAQAHCQNMLRQQPDNVDAIRLLAQIASANQYYDKAEFLLDSALLLQPDNVFVCYDLALVLQHRQKFLQAYKIASRLIDQYPDNVSFLLCFANQAAALNEFDKAKQAYEQVLSLLAAHSPQRAQVFIALGHLYKTVGQTEQAQLAYQSAYKVDCECAEAYWSLANLKRYQFSQQEFQLMLDVLEQQALTNSDKCLLSFALAKAFELKENYQRSACFYQSANHLRLSELEYDNQQHVRNIAEQKTHFPATLLNDKKLSQSFDITPIFIVGLPRAGSTLLEQILASHSKIESTWELPNIMQIAHELEEQATKNKVSLEQLLSEYSAEKLASLGARYLQETQVYHRNSQYFIDKMPNNFKHIGLIKLILPQAKIVDIRRNIKDACMANYKQYYAQGQVFSYNLRYCARYYHTYTQLMDYWSSLFPEDLLLVQYESLVENTQLQVEAICRMLGVAFENSMLNFFEGTRVVKTPSAEQVRQPIYTSSVNSWKYYTDYLPELKLFN